MLQKEMKKMFPTRIIGNSTPTFEKNHQSDLTLLVLLVLKFPFFSNPPPGVPKSTRVELSIIFGMNDSYELGIRDVREFFSDVRPFSF